MTEKATGSRLGLALQLKFYQNTGWFPERLSDLPEEAADALAGQLATSPADLREYGWRRRSSQRHRQAILTFLGVRRLVSLGRSDTFRRLADRRAMPPPRDAAGLGRAGSRVATGSAFAAAAGQGARAFGSCRAPSLRARSVGADHDGVVARDEGIDRPSARRGRRGYRLHAWAMARIRAYAALGISTFGLNRFAVGRSPTGRPIVGRSRFR